MGLVKPANTALRSPTWTCLGRWQLDNRVESLATEKGHNFARTVWNSVVGGSLDRSRRDLSGRVNFTFFRPVPAKIWTS